MTRFVLAIVILGFTFSLWAAEESAFGRLFLTPEQRAALDNARRNRIQAQALAAAAEKKPKSWRSRTSLRLLSRIRTLARIRPLPDVDLPEVAGSVAIILDGNGRWAAERGLPRTRGHERGADAARLAVRSCQERGIELLTLYAFSVANSGLCGPAPSMRSRCSR